MRILISVLLLLGLLPEYDGERRVPLLPADPDVTVETVTLDWRNPARVQLGGLTFLGGVQLKSRARGFGGFSAMTVDGERFTLLSDGGNAVSFRLDSNWRISGARAVPLPDGPGSGWSKLDRDSESLTHDPATGQLWVGFERYNQIWRYGAGFARAESHAAPPAMSIWPENGGPEAMVRLRDGSFLVLGENSKGLPDGERPGIWFPGDPTVQPRRGFRFRYRSTKWYRPTDIAELPDGRLVVIDRAFSIRQMFVATVSIVERRDIRPGAVARGRVIARFAAPVLHDNFEAIAAVQEGRDTILWIASDDNQYFFQRSLLLKFRLDDRPAKRRTARVP